MDNNNLQQQINELKAEINTLKSASTIPLSVDTAFTGRGFARIGNNILVGSGTIGFSGFAEIALPMANSNTVSIVSSAHNATTAVVGSILESGGSYYLHVEGVALENFFYVVFLTDNRYSDF